MSARAEDFEAEQRIAEHRSIWQQKPVLQRIYREEFFRRLLSFRQSSGISVEVGGGPGFLKEMFPGLLATDVIWCPWLDLVTDAERLPFKSGSIMHLMGLDILHHLERPMSFLMEAQRVLATGGRLILIETWVTPFSYLIYRYLHQEDCDLSARPLAGDAIRLHQEKKAFDGNQAIPYLLFGRRNLKATLDLLPDFKVLSIEPFCLFAYLLSFGFKPFSLLPEAFYPLVSTVERLTLPLWRSLAALRALIVLEKKTHLSRDRASPSHLPLRFAQGLVPPPLPAPGAAKSRLLQIPRACPGLVAAKLPVSLPPCCPSALALGHPPL